MLLSYQDVAGDFRAFATQNRIDLRCTTCGGRKSMCSMCGGVGIVVPTLPRIYDTGFHRTVVVKRVPFPGVVAFEHQTRVWMGADCPEADAPFHLAGGWLAMYGSALWVPDQFVDLDRPADYRRVLGRRADTFFKMLKKSLQYQAERTAADLVRVERFLTQG